MKRITFFLITIVIIATISIATAFIKSEASYQKPTKLNKLEKQTLPTSEVLKHQGAYFYDLEMKYPSLNINLYDSSRYLIANLELIESAPFSNSLYKIRLANAVEEWVRVEKLT